MFHLELLPLALFVLICSLEVSTQSPHDPNIAEMDECNPKSNKYLDDSLGRRAELWFECTLHTERWSYAIGGNMVR